ncbi:MAG TPA: LuxR C-terminal-related transcriptional regulator [Nitrospiraceae bacterium]|nr:LuxR C-terminal-related transcriptional regulator [Nitrospiraceae bacterium]
MLKELSATRNTVSDINGATHTAIALQSAVTRRARRPEDLTPREMQILQLVWEGHTSRLIAEQLKISIKTAEAHRANMMKKLRASNTAQLVKAAFEAGLLQISPASELGTTLDAVESVA